jgi:hypothetical protein
MERITRALPSPAGVVAVLALVAAVAGTAIAGDQTASTSLSKKKIPSSSSADASSRSLPMRWTESMRLT